MLYVPDYFSKILVSLASIVSADRRFLTTDNAASGERHSEGYCAIYDICGQRSDGKVLNCPFGTPFKKPDDLLSSKIQSLFPTITGNICCTESQFDTLRAQVQQAIPFLVGCPACLRNFLNFFCELSCSPNQSLFINVISIAKVGNNLTLNEIDFYVTDVFGEGQFNSCKDVKFGTMNTHAIDFIGNGAKNFKEWYAFIGKKADLDLPGSPYAINFPATLPQSSGIKPVNVTTYSCSDTSLGCSCGDCPLSPVCTTSGTPSSPKRSACTIKIGSLKAKCIEFAMAILYIVLLSMFYGWGIFNRKRERRQASRMKPLNAWMGMLEEDPQVTGGERLLVVQGYMSDFYRRYVTWVVRHPTFILISSLAVVLLLCLGLIHFKVETQPEKLWVGPGSRAAEEKQFFDNHLAPFYRIEQLILATVSDSMHGNPPSIVTESNIKLLFARQKKVDDICGNYSGAAVSLTDICLKPLGQDCATQCFTVFQMDPENYDNHGGVHYTSAADCTSAFNDPSTALGGFSGSNYSEASAFIVTYPVNDMVDKESAEALKAVAWEKAFIQLVKVSYLVMFAYISLTLGNAPMSSFYISSKVLLRLSGVVLVMLSVLGSVGFFSAIGVKSTLIIMEVIPFLVLAVGVDNMCILVQSVKRQPLELPLEGRISNVLVEVGPSITLASLSKVLAFAVGIFIPMPACRVFSMFAALAVLLDFLLQITAFVSLIVFDFLRAEDKRVDCFPCIKVSASQPETFGEYLRIGPPLYFVVKSYNYSSESNNTNQLCSISQCNSDSLLNQISRASLTPETSYIAKPAASWLDDFLVWLSPDAFGCCRNHRVALRTASRGKSEVCKACITCFRHSDLNNDRPTTAQFREKLPWFLSALPSADCSKGGHGAYTECRSRRIDLKVVSSNHLLFIRITPLLTSKFQIDYVNALKAARQFSARVSSSLKIEIFPYAVYYMFFEQYLDIWRTALIDLAIAIAIIFLVLAMIVMDLLGVMAILKIQLNAISVVNLIMSVGIAVDFCVHITHAFMVTCCDRNQRMKEALGTIGASVFSGITLTKLVGVIVLCFSRSQVFVVYYFQMYLALVLLGSLHRLEVLSMFGPPSRYEIIEKQEGRPSASPDL
ncbi:Niemann-Pick C1, N-terminal [Dillenia turbinata]|uniref:Niemann-Pick C1, N-terminal n=1 Tax=Dillenia turbinata TaxID=194707 RepID=A0AAN8W0K9_9MAGN